MTIDETTMTEGAKATLHAYGDQTEISGKSYRRAHANGPQIEVEALNHGRLQREEDEEAFLAKGASRASGAGNRAVEEEPDPYRTCFEVDRDRIRFATAFRRLQGKTQVFINAANTNDHLRNRLTHSIEVAHFATSVARLTGLNVSLVEAMALGHDCGHGPCGHASEDAFDIYMPGKVFDHAVWGADEVLTPLNLCVETLDAIRNHSWKRPGTSTPEAELVSWSDRAAYVCHDWNDARRMGIVRADELPVDVAAAAGHTQSSQIEYFVNALVAGIRESKFVSMESEAASVLDSFRRFNFERIYLREASQAHNANAVTLLRAVVEYFARNPLQIPDIADGIRSEPEVDSESSALEAVRYVNSMTDHFVFKIAVEKLGWDKESLPRAA